MLIRAWLSIIDAGRHVRVEWDCIVCGLVSEAQGGVIKTSRQHTQHRTEAAKLTCVYIKNTVGQAEAVKLLCQPTTN